MAFLGSLVGSYDPKLIRGWGPSPLDEGPGKAISIGIIGVAAYFYVFFFLRRTQMFNDSFGLPLATSSNNKPTHRGPAL